MATAKVGITAKTGTEQSRYKISVTAVLVITGNSSTKHKFASKKKAYKHRKIQEFKKIYTFAAFVAQAGVYSLFAAMRTCLGGYAFYLHAALVTFYVV